MDTKERRHWVILNDAELKLYQWHYVLQVPSQGGSSLAQLQLHQSLQDSIYHMIYLTVTHCIRHGSSAASSDLTTVYAIVSGIMLDGHLQHFEDEDLSGIKSLNLKQQALGRLRLSSFMDEIQIVTHTTSWIKWRSK